jgi:hypothetical protein
MEDAGCRTQDVGRRLVGILDLVDPLAMLNILNMLNILGLLEWVKGSQSTRHE